MTTLPIAPGGADTAVPGLAPGTGTTTPTAAGDFLAAMLQALAPTGELATTGDTTADASAPGEATEGAAADPGTGPAALGLIALPVTITLPLGTASGPVAAGKTAAADATTVAATGAATGAGTSGEASPISAATVATTDAADASAVAPGQPDEPGKTGTSTIDATTATAEVTPDAAAGPIAGSQAGTGAHGGSTADPSAQQPVAPSAPGATVVPPTATVASAPASDPAPVQQVTRQVFPEVTSLVTRGDGTHRITLSLKPEALGEVRVVMTVRDGSVHVRLAAGHEAQQALLEGSPELTRLLEQVGASDTRIVVRDLASGTTTAGTSTQLGAGGTGPQDQHAGTRAQHPATDGTHDSGTRSSRDAAGANPPRSNEPVTRTRTAGVDVTM